MSDIPEQETESTERPSNRVGSTNWDIGNAAFPTAVQINRFDIVSNGTLSVEPVLPMDNSQHNAGPSTFSGERKLDSNLQPNIAAISQGSSFESDPNKGLQEGIPNAIKADSKNDSVGGPQTISGERKYDSNPQPNIAAISQGSSFESGPSKGPMNIPSPRGESSDPISATLENSSNRARTTETSSDATATGLTSKLTPDTKYWQINAESDLVSAKITLAKTAVDTLPAFELVKTEKPSERSAEPIPEKTPQKAFDYDTRVQTQGERILAKMGIAVESTLNKDNTTNTSLEAPLTLASNLKVEENMGRIRISSVEGFHPSLNFRAFIRSASELLATKSLHSQREFRIENLGRPVELDPASNIRKLEIVRHINLKGTLPATFNIRGPESIRTATLSTVESSFNLSISERRSSLLIGQVKDALTNPAAKLNTTNRIDALSAQGILRSQFTTARGEGLTPISFTVKDARASMNIGDPKYPGYLEIGRRKKKKKNGEEEDECATNLSPESCRYISGLELGLLIALAGIAKLEGPDRSNRKVVKENQNQTPSSNFKMDIHQSREFITDAIQQNKIEKCLSSKHRDNQFKSSNKFKLKNLLRKLKEEKKELNDKDFKKLESSNTKEELLDRLSKLVAKDEKRLFSKRQLSSFSSAQKENLTQKTHPSAHLSSPIASYRPLWLVTVNDTLTKLAEQIYQDPDVGWLIADMNITRVKERYVNGKRVIELQSRQQIELPIQEDIDLFKMNKSKEATAEKLITIVQANQLDKELINSQLQALQIKRKAIGTT